jgi:hypothetical protein
MKFFLAVVRTPAAAFPDSPVRVLAARSLPENDHGVGLRSFLLKRGTRIIVKDDRIDAVCTQLGIDRKVRRVRVALKDDGVNKVAVEMGGDRESGPVRWGIDEYAITLSHDTLCVRWMHFMGEIRLREAGDIRREYLLPLPASMDTETEIQLNTGTIAVRPFHSRAEALAWGRERKNQSTAGTAQAMNASRNVQTEHSATPS